MENEDLNLDELQDNVEQKLKVKNRFEQLSEKVIVTSKERDDAKSIADAEKQARLNVEKERDFYKSFSQISSKHPEAANYQDQILERVNKGYDPEEAALAVLAKEGKLGSAPTEIHTPSIQVEGGSAITTLEGNKSVHEMSTDDKLAALMQADKTGELSDLMKR